MELILKSDNKSSIAKVVALARKLHITIVQKDSKIDDTNQREVLKERILRFKAKGASSFGDAGEWQREQRSDRDQPFTE